VVESFFRDITMAHMRPRVFIRVPKLVTAIAMMDCAQIDNSNEDCQALIAHLELLSLAAYSTDAE
jgi:hypothetical protein